jgi:serine/threonine protein phosphatase PrpC
MISRISIKEGKKGSELLIAKSREEFLQISKIITETTDLQTVYSPWRIKPGGLTVTRSFGAADSKLKERGGLPDVIISDPEVVEKHVNPNMDFVLLGSDGVFDFVQPNTAVGILWNSIHKRGPSKTQEGLAEGLNNVIQEALRNGSDDNLTLILALLPGFEKYLQDSASRSLKG